MQRTLSGIDAYNTMLSAAVPARTKTYTPVPHHHVLTMVRQYLYKSGFTISSEECRSTVNGAVISINFGIVYKSDPDIILSATFINSYDKSAKFQFSMGALVKNSQTNLIISKSNDDSIIRKHTGDALTIIEEYIKESINNTEEYWDELVVFKNQLKDFHLSQVAKERILGKLILGDVVDSVQLNQIRNMIKNTAMITSWVDSDEDNAWNWYNACAVALKSSHPNTWLTDHLKVHEVFNTMLMLNPVSGSIAVALDPSAMIEHLEHAITTTEMREEEPVPMLEDDEEAVMVEEPTWDTLREQNDDY